MQERRGPPSSSSGGRKGFRFSAEIDEPLLRENTLRDDEGAIIHDDISSLDDSDGSDFDEDDVPETTKGDEPFVSFLLLILIKKAHSEGTLS